MSIVLPVGKKDDVLRVLNVIFTHASAEELEVLWQNCLGPATPEDGYLTMASRARWRRPLSWRRQGVAFSSLGLLLRRGSWWRKVAVFPLARLQGLSLHQGPISRIQRVATIRLHTVSGQVSDHLVAMERDNALELLDSIGTYASDAAKHDATHRWAESPVS